MAYRLDFNRFTDVAAPLEDSGIVFDYELSVSEDMPHVAACCCEDCDGATIDEFLVSDDFEFTDYDPSSDFGNYVNYGANGYSNPYLDFGAVQNHEANLMAVLALMAVMALMEVILKMVASFMLAAQTPSLAILARHSQ